MGKLHVKHVSDLVGVFLTSFGHWVGGGVGGGGSFPGAWFTMCNFQRQHSPEIITAPWPFGSDSSLASTSWPHARPSQNVQDKISLSLLPQEALHL